jgi:ankyrin repeat protein
VVAAFWFDDGSAKTITALFKAGLIDALIGAGSLGESEQDSAVALSKLSMSALANAATTENFPLHRLQDQYFSDLTVLGWAIQLGRPKVLQYLLKRGYKPTLPVDAEGNPAMHFVAMHGTAEMAEMILADKNLRLEQSNRAGWTAGMVAVRQKNFGVAKRLFDARADCRRSLDGAYAAWVLAFVRRREKHEVNTQTGRYGDDDILYFDISPDPFYVTWYAYS